MKARISVPMVLAVSVVVMRIWVVLDSGSTMRADFGTRTNVTCTRSAC